MTKNRRKKFLIDPAGQWRYVGRILFLEVLVAIPCVVLTAFVTAFIAMEGAGGSGNYWTKVAVGCGVLCVLLAAILVYLGVRISHRIYGPVYQMQRVVATANEEEGIPGPLHLRQKDEFKELATLLNECFDRMREEKGEGTASS